MSKIKSAQSDIVRLMPSKEELAFMKQNDIAFQPIPCSGGLVTVNRKDFADFVQLSA